MIPITPPELWAFSAHTDRQAQLILDLGMEFSVVKNGLGQVTDEYVIAIENLNKWLEENDLVGYRRRRSPEHRTFTIIRAGNPNISFVRRGTWCVDILTKEYDQMLRGDAYFGSSPIKFDPIVCNRCSTSNPSRSIICSGCDALFYCTACHRTANHADYENAMGSYCSRCGIACSTCDHLHSGRFGNECTACDPIWECYYCGDTGSGEPPNLNAGNTTCNACFENVCQECSTHCNPYDRTRVNLSADGRRLCSDCIMTDGDNKEAFDDGAEMPATHLALPTIPGREDIRLCGVEIEGGNGKDKFRAGDYIARTLYDENLTENYNQVGYHHGSGFARIETDASCDWECVIGPINMAHTDDVRKFNKVVKIIRSAIKEEKATLDLRCGTHIHVSAERVALENAYNLHTLYVHLEDLLYRLGAAKWPIHRSLLRIGDDHYKTNPKMDSMTRFARTFHEDRYYGLSFNNYFERMYAHCRCGAAKYGVFEECTCSMNKCTFEFRLFNSTSNTVKLHAYLALCQSLVAKAISMDRIKDDSIYPEMNFVQKKFSEMSNAEKNALIEGWKPRLSFIANELPLTPEEKKSIHYCVANSDVRELEDFSKELFLAETEVNN